jgi:HPt (histidine-containing phosphotransfer) domain-containing protein
MSMAPDFQHESTSYDLTYLNELSSGDFLFVQNIIKQFIDEAPLAIEEIFNASNEQKWEDLIYQVHKFAPNLAFIGINDISKEITNLESFAKNRSNLAAIPQLVDILRKRCEIAINSLKKDFEL